MNLQVTHPLWLLALPVALAWVSWLAWRSDVHIQTWRRVLAFVLRVLVVTAVILALAGLQWKKPQDGMNIYFLMDRSQSVPSSIIIVAVHPTDSGGDKAIAIFIQESFKAASIDTDFMAYSNQISRRFQLKVPPARPPTLQIDTHGKGDFQPLSFGKQKHPVGKL